MSGDQTDSHFVTGNKNEPMVQAVHGALQGTLHQDKEEIDSRRKRNVIVHGIAESEADSSEQRVDDDLTVLAAMFHEAGVSDVQVESTIRLGKS